MKKQKNQIVLAILLNLTLFLVCGVIAFLVDRFVETSKVKAIIVWVVVLLMIAGGVLLNFLMFKKYKIITRTEQEESTLTDKRNTKTKKIIIVYITMGCIAFFAGLGYGLYLMLA